MRRSLRILGATALASCLYCGSGSAQTPLDSISSKMAGVSGDLEKKETGAPVQVQEKAIVEELDELIASLEKQCQACRNGIKKNNPNRGMRDSAISRGTGGMGPLAVPGESAKDWAKLSARERDRILQSMSEGFPPEYRTVLERYYRRLAEEKAAAPAADRPQPKAAEPRAAKP